MTLQHKCTRKMTFETLFCLGHGTVVIHGAARVGDEDSKDMHILTYVFLMCSYI